METKICKHCKEQIAKDAKRCPKCGGKQGLSGCIIALLIVVGIVILLGGCTVACTGSLISGVDKAVKEVNDSYKDKNGKTTFKVGETFENSYEKITLLEVDTNFKGYSEYNKPASGKKYVMAKFEVEATKQDNDELYVSALSFNAFADGVSVEQEYYMSDKYNDISATLTYGKKSVGYIFYEVPTNTQKITIDYNADFWTDGTKIEFVVQE
ncbi:MAG: DUF4352 domain-containing protein [Bacilli bacterium]|nr:DUF4352 domain-containing protein [Bacilli bacterium]